MTSDDPQTTHLTGQIGGTDLIVCSKCGWTHMRLMACNATPDDSQRRQNSAARELLKIPDVQKIMTDSKTTGSWQVDAGFFRATYPHKVAPECPCEIGSTCRHRPCCYYGGTVPENVRSVLGGRYARNRPTLSKGRAARGGLRNLIR